MNIYLVFSNADLTEGRGPMILRGVFPFETPAIEYAKRLPNVMGVFPGTGIHNQVFKAKLNEEFKSPYHLEQVFPEK